jgi:hypothetical protein
MKRTSLLLGVLSFVCSLSLQAQDAEAWVGLPLRFDTPGARSLGMGAAAVAVTDDAALAAVNPAALASVGKRTFAAEYRDRRNTARFSNQGSVTELTSAQGGVSSAVLVLPQETFTWAAFYDEPINASARNISLPSGTAFVPARSDVRLRRYGVAAAWKRGKLSAGGALRYDSLRLLSGWYTMQPVPGVATPAQYQRVRSGEFTYNAGVQWQAAPALKVGAVYARGAHYEALRQVDGGPGFVPPFIYFTQFRTPSSLGAGASWSASRNVTLAADAVRVHYAEMTPGATFVIVAVGGVPPVVMHDATELHAGAEYRVTPLVALRAGWWRDPAHGPVALGGPYDQITQAALQPDADENHVTAGVGIGSERLRFDAAYDHGERTRRASVGVATTF